MMPKLEKLWKAKKHNVLQKTAEVPGFIGFLPFLLCVCIFRGYRIMRKMFIMLFCVLFLCSCSPDDSKINPPSQSENELPEAGTPPTESSPQAVYRRITPEEAYNIMAAAEDFILLDVRTEEEYREQRIPGAVLLPYDEIGSRAEAELPDKDALILIYCRLGRRSAIAANELLGMGYANVYDFGGITEWHYETIGD